MIGKLSPNKLWLLLIIPMGNKNKSIVTIGLSGFPFGMAASQKLFLMGKAIAINGSDFTVISNTFIKETDLNKKLEKKGTIDSVKYLTTSPFIFSPQGVLKKIWGKFIGILLEFLLIIKLKRQKKLDVLIIYSMSFLYTAFYGLLAKLLNISSYFVYFELRSSCTNRKGFGVKLNDKLLDKQIFRFVSGVITISENLVQQVKKYSPNKKYIVVPPLVDFDQFKIKRAIEDAYFLYCGTLAYIEVIEFIIDSYTLLKSSEYKMFMVLNGSSKELEKITKKINDLGLQKQIRILSNLEYDDLINYYTNAKALLIPLRNTPQDVSRFPQKVAEYCAAKNPIISNKIGEMVNYFNDSSIVFCKGYDKAEFAEKLKYVIDNKEECERIALNAYKIGEENFDYKSFSKPLYSFLIG